MKPEAPAEQLIASNPAQEEPAINPALLTIWEKTIDVQMHFNDLQLRIRNFAILIVSAFVGGLGVALKENFLIQWHGLALPVASLVFFIAAFIWMVFYFMDALWYHPLLLGAVSHGRLLEEEMKKVTGIQGLTETISKASPTKILGLEIHSKHKARYFYRAIAIGLIAMGVLLIGAKRVPQDAPAQATSIATASRAEQDKAQSAEPATVPNRAATESAKPASTPTKPASAPANG